VQGAKAVAVIAVYVALEWASFLHDHRGIPITPWNPGLGVVFAAIILAGWPAGAMLFVGVITAEIFVLDTSVDASVVVGVAGVVSLSYTAAAIIARQRLRLDIGLARLRDVLVLLATGLTGAAVASALLAAALIGAGELEADEALHAALSLLVGDTIGIAVVTPLLLRLFVVGRATAFAGLAANMREAVVLVGLVFAGLWAIIGSETAESSKYFYIFFLPVVFAAVRHGIDGACVSLAVTQLGMVGLLHLYDYDARIFTEYQMLMFVLTSTALIVGVVVSERRNADRLVREAGERLKEMEAEAAQAGRLSLVSGMASAIAHEINQPMTAARALARSAQHLLGQPDPNVARAADNLASITTQIDHASGVIRRMRDFLRRGTPHMSTLNVAALLQESLVLVRSEAAAQGVRLELDVSADLPAVHGDRVQLQQVVLNLVRNGIEASARAAEPCVRVSARAESGRDEVVIGVSDNGAGLDAGLAQRLFAPLMTTKREGLGLGLAICASIVEAHGGRIWLQSGEPGATEFRFSLPVQASGPR
jgi:signal transduction histidine kinase